ncbi:MAG TPA: membrane protein insertase YidC [Kofleriaceae bacterium]|jgi:YidC/Oxa1 family membrane protein insertase
MEGQGKRLLVFVVLMIGVMFVWQTFFFKKPPPKPADAGSGAGSAAAIVAQTPRERHIGPAAAPEASSFVLPTEDVFTVKGTNAIATFSSRCGGLKSWQLTDKRYEHDPMRGAMLPDVRFMTKQENGKSVPLQGPELAGAPVCGAFDVNFDRDDSTYVIPANAVWKGSQPQPNVVEYKYTSDTIDVTKTFTVNADKYFVRMALSYTLHVPAGHEAHQTLAVASFGFQDPGLVSDGSSRIAARMWSASSWGRGEDKLGATDVKKVIEWPRYEPDVLWAGFSHPYLLAGFAPKTAPVGEQIKTVVDTRNMQGVLMPTGTMRDLLLFPTLQFTASSPPATYEIVGYLGPRNYDALQAADTEAGFTTGLRNVVDLGWFGFIGRPLLWILLKLHDVVRNWGVAIVLLTFLVKGATLYWTTKSMRSMKAMAALGPQMKGLQAKYGTDKQRVQAETMALYKQHGVNPVAGCLPMVLQMPIWLALYRMLQNAGELYQQPFIPHWIDDLTNTDPLHILPILLVVTMFAQARLQPAAADSTQQKIMQYGMPLLFGFMSFYFPAGLTIYIFTNTVLSAVHSIYMNKFDKKSLEIMARLKASQEAAKAADEAAKKPAPAPEKPATTNDSKRNKRRK